MRYINSEDGLSISEIDTDSVLTYLDGELVRAQAPDWYDENSTATQYANVSAIYNNRLWIKNSMPVKCDLLISFDCGSFDRLGIEKGDFKIS